MRGLLNGKSPSGALERLEELAGRDLLTDGDTSPAGVWQKFYWQIVWPLFEGAVAAEAATLTTTTGSVANIRAALIAARQCEVLAEELAAPKERNFLPNSVSEILDELAGYRVGMEALRTPKVEADVKLFHRVADSAGLAVARNVELATSATGGGNKLPNRLGRMTQQLGRIAVTALFGTKRDLLWTLKVPIILMVLSIVLVVTAILVDPVLLALALVAASAVLLVASVVSLVFGGRIRSPGPFVE
jgi:hypothetical protein